MRLISLVSIVIISILVISFLLLRQSGSQSPEVTRELIVNLKSGDLVIFRNGKVRLVMEWPSPGVIRLGEVRTSEVAPPETLASQVVKIIQRDASGYESTFENLGTSLSLTMF